MIPDPRTPFQSPVLTSIRDVLTACEHDQELTLSALPPLTYDLLAMVEDMINVLLPWSEIVTEDGRNKVEEMADWFDMYDRLVRKVLIDNGNDPDAFASIGSEVQDDLRLFAKQLRLQLG